MMTARYRSFHCVSYIYIEGERRKAKQGLLEINLLFYHLAVFTLIWLFPLPAARCPRRRLSSATQSCFENAIIK